MLPEMRNCLTIYLILDVTSCRSQAQRSRGCGRTNSLENALKPQASGSESLCPTIDALRVIVPQNPSLLEGNTKSKWGSSCHLLECLPRLLHDFPMIATLFLADRCPQIVPRAVWQLPETAARVHFAAAAKDQLSTVGKACADLNFVPLRQLALKHLLFAAVGCRYVKSSDSCKEMARDTAQ